MRRPEVKYTEDFIRVENLPRRRISQSEGAEWAAHFAEELRAPGSREVLRWQQGQLIYEAVENRGAFGVLPVGFGKTIPSWVLAIAMNACRPMIIIPAGLRDKTMADFASYRGKWRTPNPPPAIFSREDLAQDSNLHLFDKFQPDLIIIDEADELANAESAACVRIDRYVQPRSRDDVAVVCMTGTPARNSIMGFWHILCWCLREGAPVPMTQGEARTWALALDEQGKQTGRRMLCGPLGPNLKAARKWFQVRLAETPGVFILDGDSAGDIPITIRTRLAKECPKLNTAYHKFMVEQENPDGVPVAAPLDRWRVDRFLGCGLFMRYKKPGPPEEWLVKRRARGRAYAALVRETIKGTRSHESPADTEKQVRRKHRTGRGRMIIDLWDEVADDPYPTEAVWISSATIETARDWLAESAEPGIIWCGCVEFGETLARTLRLPYFGPKGKDQNGNDLDAISKLPAWWGRSFVASWNANKKGFNLQKWRRFAVFDPPTSAKWKEQLSGRNHRQLQDRAVVIDEFMTSGGTLDAFEIAMREARFGKSIIGTTQKILRAKIVRAKPTKTDANKFRWAQRDDDDDD